MTVENGFKNWQPLFVCTNPISSIHFVQQALHILCPRVCTCVFLQCVCAAGSEFTSAQQCVKAAMNPSSRVCVLISLSFKPLWGHLKTSCLLYPQRAELTGIMSLHSSAARTKSTMGVML